MDGKNKTQPWTRTLIANQQSALSAFLKEINAKLNVKRQFALGLDRGTHALRYVLMDQSSKRIVQWGCLEFGAKKSSEKTGKAPEGSFSALLTALSKSIPKDRLRSVRINVQESSVMMGRFQIPATSKEQQPDLLRMALKDQLSYPVDDAAYYCREYAQIQERREGEKNAKETLKFTFHFAAAPKRLVGDLVNSVEDVFEIVPAVDLQGYAHESLIEAAGLCDENETVAFLNVGRSTTIISIFQDGRLVFERNIPLAGQDITRAILITYLQGNEPRTTKDLGVAENLKKDCVIPLSGAEKAETVTKKDKFSSEENQLLFQSMESVLTAWVQDIRLSFSFFNEHYNGTKISRVYLTGGSANLKNLSGYLTQELGIPTELLAFNDKSSLQLDESLDAAAFKEKFHEYATAVALAIEPEGHMGLTPKEFQTGYLERLGVPVLRVVSFLLVAIMILWVSMIAVQLRNSGKVRTVLSDQQRFLAEVEKPYHEMLRWQQLTGSVDTRRAKTSTILKIISNRIPNNLIFTKIAVERDQGNFAAEGFIYGDAKRRAVTIAEFSKALEETAYFKNVKVPQMNPIEQQQLDAASFRLTADLVEFDQV